MIKVLIVEDENLIRKKLLHFIDYDALGMVVVADGANGVEGVELIKKYQPDIVLADINMPEKDGLDMISETLDYDYIAIIISGYDYFSYAQRALKYGVTDYLLKPISLDDLEESLTNARELIYKKRDVISQKTSLGNAVDISLDKIIKDSTVLAMINYIKNNYQDKISISDLSKELAYSESMLNRKFKKEVHLTFNEYLNRYRINKAIELLENSDYNISEIAYMCGYSSAKYFSRVFKKYLGIAPSDL
ncbi:helix-turn-helix domain-containing protein [uncultured Anaerococcus sp.]|uniref:response regulator transcription factor n=1 Tax=uncultured Anaerococcus sp. TaxID=293428 RepID=UPI0026185061|nr:helix-turn-helix domain-containing protein [uncultured Anaerococcus sp.]